MTFDASLFAGRRAAIAARMRAAGGGVLLLPAAEEKIRSNDSEYLFRQDSDFFYATGFDEPDGCALLFAGPEGEKPKLVMFVRPRDKDREIWTGRRAGVDGAQAVYGADEAYPLEELGAKLPQLVDGQAVLWYRLGFDPGWDTRVTRLLVALRSRSRAGSRAPDAVLDPGRVIHELRLLKSREELARLRRACEVTREAHVAAMRCGRPGAREYEVQAAIEHAFRRGGAAGPGYGTIVASGGNSCILHYRAGDEELRAGHVCLVDAGAEYEVYSADVTRTFPVSGRFTPAQRELYELCLGSQVAAIEAVRPGATLDAIHESTVRYLTEGLVRLGLLAGSVEERIADGAYKKYYMHRTSHWLGMDVHDVGAYYVDGKPRVLAPGMVLTVEPGVYVAEDDAGAPEEMRGVGIRIEDDVLVTEQGHENLTAGVPKTVAEVEAACAR